MQATWQATLTVLWADRPGKAHKVLCRSVGEGRLGARVEGCGIRRSAGDRLPAPPARPQEGCTAADATLPDPDPTPPPPQSGSARAQSGVSAGHRGREWQSGRGRGRQTPSDRAPQGFSVFGRRPSAGTRGTDLPRLHLALPATPRPGQETRARACPTDGRGPVSLRHVSPAFRLRERGAGRTARAASGSSPRLGGPGAAGNCSSCRPVARPGPARPAQAVRHALRPAAS